MSLLEVANLSKSFSTRRDFLGRRTGWTHAVHDVSFTLDAGECLAVVGESGAGKSTVGRMVLRLIEPDSGTVTFDGENVLSAKPHRLREMRRAMQMIFQDPHSSLDPRMTVADAVTEPLIVHTDLDRTARQRRAGELLDKVGIGPRYLGRYPAELSGGQLQRVAIARALTLDPKMIVCDEPVAALDVSVRAQVLNLLRDLQEELGLAYLFVCHDLALIEVIADRVLVMKSGEVVETGFTTQIYSDPEEDYTRALLAAIPDPIPRSRVFRASSLSSPTRSPG
ncbi:ATP-binding cassette domain-containing protein [Rhodococcus chondri]|uniref:ATP-binding cassette domain-containing protein n=1 Tax=Rhodococcus chondri TaxID=3065941 RepID=A0ABU7JVX9_9NOCA|nr:ATP-binding cassette domain-containing protein [Rhodococcus sp. CC-R104]MEE2034175.1 ATP-binding cassette domain-containing protein [Rhodococcus sp. CC-R104]